jgi:hypothetical protein
MFGVCVCVCVYAFFCVCAVLCLGRGLATSWSPAQGVLPSVNDQETEKSALCSEVGARGDSNNNKIMQAVSYCSCQGSPVPKDLPTFDGLVYNK